MVICDLKYYVLQGGIAYKSSLNPIDWNFKFQFNNLYHDEDLIQNEHTYILIKNLLVV